MKISIHITKEKLVRRGGDRVSEGCGALVEFAGVVRGEEDGRKIEGLSYETYETMAKKEIEKICVELGMIYPCEAVEIVHRVGFIPAEEAAIHVRIESRHRMEGFRFLDLLMKRLKQDVPIWKMVG